MQYWFMIYIEAQGSYGIAQVSDPDNAYKVGIKNFFPFKFMSEKAAQDMVERLKRDA